MAVINCSKCKKDFVVTFTGAKSNNGCPNWINKKLKKGFGRICYECKRKRVNSFHRKNNFIKFKKYEKTIGGYLMRMYRNMKSRVTGVQKQKSHLYLGKELLNKKDFYAWAKASAQFKIMFEIYKNNGYSRRLAPTVNRIDSSRGYSLDNMEWLTHSDNSRLGAVSQWDKSRAKTINFP